MVRPHQFWQGILPGDQFDDAPLLISERRESVGQAHTSGACFSRMDETSAPDQRLILILVEAFFPGAGIPAAQPTETENSDDQLN
jgi:hypothetical protein